MTNESTKHDAAEAGRASTQRVFISYASPDVARADALCRIVSLFTKSVFFDRRSLEAGDEWREQLLEHVGNAQLVLVLWTAVSAKSQWVDLETKAALSAPSCRVVPVLGDETPLPSELAARQAITGIPLLNEVLELQRDLLQKGVPATAVSQVVRQRLEKAGIQLSNRDRQAFNAMLGVRIPVALIAGVIVVLALLAGGGAPILARQLDGRLSDCEAQRERFASEVTRLQAVSIERQGTEKSDPEATVRLVMCEKELTDNSKSCKQTRDQLREARALLKKAEARVSKSQHGRDAGSPGPTDAGEVL